MVRSRLWLGALALGGACDPAAPPAEVQPVVLSAADVVYVRLDRISSGPRLAGTLEPADRAVIRAEAAGSVVAVEVDIGDRVTPGQLLARIEPSGTGDQWRSAQASVAAADQDLANAQRDLERTDRLVAAGALSARDLESARSAVIAVKARVAAARAQQSASGIQLRRTTVTSPIAGLVSDRSVGVGDVVGMGAAMFTVIEPSSLRLEGSVPPTAISELRLQDPVRFKVQGYADRSFLGTVERISPAVDPVSRQIPVVVSVPNEAGTLVAGLFADGQVATQEHQGLIVASDGVDRTGSTAFVLRVADGHVERVDVQIGLVDPAADVVEITSGVREGDALVVSVARDIPPGTPVQLDDASRRSAVTGASDGEG